MPNFKKSFVVYFLACLSIILLSSPQTRADTTAPISSTYQWSNICSKYSGQGGAVFAIAYKDPNTIYAGTTNEIGEFVILKTTDGGITCSDTNPHFNIFPQRIFDIKIDPYNPSTIYAGTVDGYIFKTVDAGITWDGNQTGYTTCEITSLALDYKTPNILYAGSIGAGIFKSLNGGSTWNEMSIGLTNLQVLSLAIDPNDSNTLYAGTTSGGVFKTTNGGDTWYRASNYFEIPSLAIDPKNSRTIYAAAEKDGVLKSVDAGATWIQLTEGLELTYVQAIAIDPNNSTTLYVGTNGNGLFKSINGGTTWNLAVNELDSLDFKYINQLVIDPNNSDVIYVGTTSGLFKIQKIHSYLLEVEKIGSGKIISSPQGIDCGSECSKIYSQGASITLTAFSDAGSIFTGWVGCDMTSGNICTVSMNNNKKITTTFTQNCDLSLIININQPSWGTVTKNPDKSTYCFNEQVTLTANPNTGYNFNSWGGIDSSNGTAASITMNDNRTVTANFSQQNSNGPDLTGAWTSLVQQCSGTKCKINGNFNVQNMGNKDASSSLVRFYLSDDGVYDEGDSFLKEVKTGTLKVGKSKSISLSYSFTSGISATNKFIIAVVDAENTISETNESNNIVIYGPILPADLTGTWISMTQQCKKTKCSINGTLNIQNIGYQDAASFSVRFYLSGDDVYGGGDTFLKQVSSVTVKAGKSSGMKISFTLPSGVTATNKYIIALIDADNKIIEADKSNNNIAYGPIP